MAAPPIHHVNLMDTEDDISGYLSTLKGVPSISGDGRVNKVLL
jgi:hypothetical protein